MKLKLGSLFDGSGGFPLAGAIHGVTPVWASEIEPYPIRVTTARFPDMKHLGDVSKIDGAEIEPVDIITFGSPCQDLSVAGKRDGLEGNRSNLFYEAIRIIKEMRNATNNIYPRIAVWENVPGAFSSNKGEDFRAVLQAFCSVKDEAADVPRPASGKWNTAGAIVGSGWSVAWRTFDAQYWGVPQRRRRIYLIADFGSERAGEILFEPESVRRDSAPSGAAGEGTSGNAEGSVGRGYECLTPWDVQSRRVHDDSGAWPAIYGGEGGGHGYVLRQATPADAEGSVGRSVCAYDIGEARLRNPQEYFELSPTLTQRCGTGGNNTPAVCYSVDCRNMNLTPEHGTLQAKENGGQSLNYMGAVCYPIDSHQQDSRFKVCADGISPTLPGQMGTGGNNGPMVLTYRKTAHPRTADEGQGWEPTEKADTLNVFDNSESRTPTAIVYSAGNGQTNQPLLQEQARTLDCMHDQQIVLVKEIRDGAEKKAGCREVLLGLWRAYVEETLQRDTGEQPGVQQTEVLQSEVHGRALDKPAENRNEQRILPCDCTEGSGCWVLRNMRKTERKGCASQGRELSEQQPGQLDADLQELPQQTAQDGEEMQGLRGEGQRSRILQQALHTVQEIWKPAHDKSQPVQRKYIIRRLTPLETSRLQGFPDCWCSGIETENPAEEEIAFWTEVWETHRKIIGTSKKPKSRKQIIKWLQNPHSDTAEYRMWGNGIALPNAAHVVGCAVKLIEGGT